MHKYKPKIQSCLLQTWMYLELWRWCLFFAFLAPLYFFSKLLVHVLVMLVEREFFTKQQAMYFVVSIRVRSSYSLSLFSIHT